MASPLDETMNHDTSADLWETFLDSLPDGEPEPALAGTFSFGDTPDLADELGRLVADGEKTATAEALWTFQASEDPVPEPGDHWVVVDAADEPLCVIQTDDVSVVAFDEVTADHAAAEGEGDRSLSFWRDAHREYYGRTLPEGRAVSDDMPVVCERFHVVYRP